MIKITKFDGDLSATRHVAVGGDASIEGSALVSHNLKVGGRLDARAIRGGDRGLYPTAESLQQQWPAPEAGWWALVGTSVPAMLYVVQDGEWVCTGNMAGEFAVEISSAEEMAQLRSDVSSLTTRLDALTDRIEATEGGLTHTPTVMFFNSVVNSAVWRAGTSSLMSTSVGSTILYVTTLKCFVLNALVMVSGALTPVNYRDWADRYLYADDSLMPYDNKLYVERTTGKIYRLVNGELAPLSD